EGIRHAGGGPAPPRYPPAFVTRKGLPLHPAYARRLPSRELAAVIGVFLRQERPGTTSSTRIHRPRPALPDSPRTVGRRALPNRPATTSSERTHVITTVPTAPSTPPPPPPLPDRKSTRLNSSHVKNS